MKRQGLYAVGDDDDAILPAELLAAEEAALQALPPAAPLEPAEVDALVAVATVRPRVLARRLLLLAGLLAIAIAPLGWIGAKIVWPERRHAPLTLTFVDAIDVATNPAYDTAGHESAAGVIAQACGFGAMALKAASTNATPAVRARATALRAELENVLDGAPLDTPIPLDEDVAALAETLADTTRPDDVRIAAMETMARTMRNGLMALRVSRANVLSDGVSAEKMDAWLGRLSRELR